MRSCSLQKRSAKSNALTRLQGVPLVQKFRSRAGLYQGMTVNFLYTAFRLFTGIYYGSVWFLSMAAYHFVLGCIRAYLVYAYRRSEVLGEAYAKACSRRAGGLLLLLDLPMGVMMFLMVQTDAGYSYPGYVIYLSAMYTFYMMTRAVIALVKSRASGDPILFSAKLVSFIAAMMSILGLQTAMIAAFSANDENFRRMMNGVTGGAIYGIVVMLSLYMLFYRKKIRQKEGRPRESLRK